jgi:RNA polymerase sigma-70 factor, ECF subfamily
VDVDDTLVAEAARGDRDAFNELVSRHHAKMYQLARIMTRGDREAEDLVQETFVRAFRAVGRFRGDSTFRTWLHRIAVNVIKSHVVRRGRLRAAEDDDGMSEQLVERLASREDLENTVVRRQTIDRALATLPESERMLIVLRDVQGLEYREIASITGLPMGTVESRIFRGRQRLRPLLESLMLLRRA